MPGSHRQHLVLVEVPPEPVNPLSKLKALPAALQLMESVLLQNVRMTPLLRYRDMRPIAQVRRDCHPAANG